MGARHSPHFVQHGLAWKCRVAEMMMSGLLGEVEPWRRSGVWLPEGLELVMSPMFLHLGIGRRKFLHSAQYPVWLVRESARHGRCFLWPGSSEEWSQAKGGRARRPAGSSVRWSISVKGSMERARPSRPLQSAPPRPGRAGVPLRPPNKGRVKEQTRRSAERAYEVGQGMRKPRSSSGRRSEAIRSGRAKQAAKDVALAVCHVDANLLREPCRSESAGFPQAHSSPS
jgi:hypothetical protein